MIIFLFLVGLLLGSSTAYWLSNKRHWFDAQLLAGFITAICSLVLFMYFVTIPIQRMEIQGHLVEGVVLGAVAPKDRTRADAAGWKVKVVEHDMYMANWCYWNDHFDWHVPDEVCTAALFDLE